METAVFQGHFKVTHNHHIAKSLKSFSDLRLLNLSVPIDNSSPSVFLEMFHFIHLASDSAFVFCQSLLAYPDLNFLAPMCSWTQTCFCLTQSLPQGKDEGIDWAMFSSAGSAGEESVSRLI